MNRRVLWIVGGCLAVLILAGVGTVLFFVTRQDDNSMTPQQAKQHVVGFVEDTIAHAIPGRTGTLQDPRGTRGSCHRFGALTDQTSRVYRWVIEDVDAATAEQLIARTDEFWRQRGIETLRDDGPVGVTAILGTDQEDDFGYNLTVNRNERRASIRGGTPCLDGDPPWSDDL